MNLENFSVSVSLNVLPVATRLTSARLISRWVKTTERVGLHGFSCLMLLRTCSVQQLCPNALLYLSELLLSFVFVPGRNIISHRRSGNVHGIVPIHTGDQIELHKFILFVRFL